MPKLFIENEDLQTIGTHSEPGLMSYELDVATSIVANILNAQLRFNFVWGNTAGV